MLGGDDGAVAVDAYALRLGFEESKASVFSFHNSWLCTLHMEALPKCHSTQFLPSSLKDLEPSKMKQNGTPSPSPSP